ncbi:hypothetical protein LSH36_45g08059 [Paralvinella palmiformis]|uniref:Uncharacterized protein n=1 Tax=Paralvinella palmiformis TaxID=53620 RepID=A0AAD9K7C9_9ANNE|nr:hypothetical protein LSH36_45g08059 [Paralvinella palmiformis]
MAGLKYSSEPAIRNDNNAPHLHETSLDLCEPYKPSTVHSDPGNDDQQPHTYLSGVVIKATVLVCMDPAQAAALIERSRNITLLPFKMLSNLLNDYTTRCLHGGENRQLWCHERSFLHNILTKNIHACFTRQSLENEEYVACIEKLIETRKCLFGKANEMITSVLKIKALLLGGLISLPENLRELFPVVVRNMSLRNIAEFLEGREVARYKTVTSLVNNQDIGARQIIIIKPKVHGLSNDDIYLKKSYEAIFDIFEDASFYPRQQLLQMLHIPNVQVLRSDSRPDVLEACVEILPNSLGDYLDFLIFYHTGNFRRMVQENMRVNNELFSGFLEIILKSEQVITVLKYFHPTVVRNYESYLNDLLRANQFDKVVTLVRNEPPCHIHSKSKVHELGGLCATVIYKAFLERENLSPFEYLRYLRTVGCPDYLTRIRTFEGYGSLHLAIKYERTDFLKMLFYMNKWAKLWNDLVKPVNAKHGNMHVGYTPRRLGEALSFKNTGYQILLLFDEYERYIRHMPAIHRACLAGSIEFVSIMIETHPELIFLEDEYCANCLIYACASGSANLVEFLLLKGAGRDLCNRDGDTPFHVAAMCGYQSILEVLFKHSVNIRGRPNKWGYSALDYCVQYGDIDILNFYKTNGFKINPMLLTIAAKYKQSKAFDLILDEVNDVNTGRDDEGRLPLHYSVINGSVSGVKKLLHKGANIQLVDKYNKNVLHHASEHGRMEVLKTLIEEAKALCCLDDLISQRDIFTGKDLLLIIRGKDQGRRAWHWVELKRLSFQAFSRAVKSGQVGVGQYGRILISGFGTGPDKESYKMMKRRSEDVFNESQPDMTPLHIATLKDHADVVAVLLKKRANPDAVDYFKATPMHYAAMNDSISTLKLLSDAGGSEDATTNDGKTPYIIAKDNANPLAINFFLAMDPVKKARAFQEILSEFSVHISLENLQKIRESGKDTRSCLVNYCIGVRVIRDTAYLSKLIKRGRPILYKTDSYYAIPRDRKMTRTMPIRKRERPTRILHSVHEPLQCDVHETGLPTSRKSRPRSKLTSTILRRLTVYHQQNTLICYSISLLPSGQKSATLDNVEEWSSVMLTLEEIYTEQHPRTAPTIFKYLKAVCNMATRGGNVILRRPVP